MFYTQYPVTQYSLPDGQRTQHTLSLHEKDAEWFRENDAKLSLERLRTGQYALYASLPYLDEQDGGESIKLASQVGPDDFGALRKVTEGTGEALQTSGTDEGEMK